MNPKERYFAGMARATIGKITANRENWTDFLNTMAQNYSFTYPEQVMIYAQRPNATMCKPYDEWNSPNFKRYVKRGSTGIAMFIANSEKPALRYVFDVADTGVRRNSPSLNPWQVTNDSRNFVMKAMEKSFGIPAEGILEAQLEEIANQLVNDYWQDYKKPISDIVADSFLEEYDEYNIEVAFKRAAAISVSYAMYTRLTDNPDNYFEHEDFLNVFDFNTRQTVNALGTAVNQISTRMFQEIEKAIHEYEQIQNVERSMNHDERNDLQPQRGLSDSEHHAGEYRNEASGQVWQDEKSVSGTEQSDAVERSDSLRAAVSAPVGNRRDSAPQSRAVDAAVSDAEPGPGQSEGSDGMGAAHEQSESAGRGNRDDGTYQQLSLNLFLSEEGQIKFIDEAESKTPSAFSFAQEEIDHILQLGVNEDEGRMIVALDYMKQKPIGQIVETLKAVYHGGFGLKDEKRNISAWYTEEGIRLAQGDCAEQNNRAQVILWEDVAKRIGELMDAGQYATNVELEEALGYERTQIAQKLWYFAHDFSEGTADKYMFSLQDIRGFRGGFPDETQHLANMLTEENIRYGLKRDLREFIEAYQENPSLLRFHYHKLNQLEQRLQELDLPIKEYHSELTAVPLMRRFITDDELNAALCRGSGVEGGKARIYKYWQANHTKQEKAEWLKNEYGTGGHSHALSGTSGSGEDHNARGMSFTKAGCEKVQFTWAQIAARLDNLMLNDLYLTADEKAKLEQHHAAQAPQPVVSYNEYNEIKEKHPDSIVLYQVGDFFEMYGEDAKIAAAELNLTLTTKAIPDAGRVDMCGIPLKRLNPYLDMLTGMGHDVTISSIQEDVRNSYMVISTHKELPLKMEPIGRIDYLVGDGEVAASQEYADATKFERDIRMDLYDEVPLNVVLYRNGDGKTIPYSFIDELDPAPKSVKVEEFPEYWKDKIKENLTAEAIENEYLKAPEKANSSPFVQQVMADVERIAAEQEPSYERFSVVPDESGSFVIWDDLHNGIYVNEDGIGEQFVTEQEAQAALEEAKEKADAQTAADWLYVEQAKVGTQEEQDTQRNTVNWDEMFQEIEIFDQPSLFSNRRLTDTEIPDGLYRYDLRGSDYDPGNPVTVEKNVLVNHAASIITAKPLDLGKEGVLSLTEDEGLNFVGGNVTLKEFYQEQVQIDKQKGISDRDVRLLFEKTPYLKAERGEIATFFMENADTKARISYLQQKFNYEFSEVILDDKRRFGYKTHNDYLEVWEGNYLTAEAKRNLSWSEVEAQFVALIQQEQRYKIGDTVYLENDPYKITGITEHHVELLPYGQIYPIYRNESKENFERLLAQDERNHSVLDSVDKPREEYTTKVQEVITGKEHNLPYDVVIQTISTSEPKRFIDHYYVAEDLQKRGPLEVTEYSTFEDAFRAYQLLPTDKVKALGIEKVSDPLPGVLDMIQCIDGTDKVIQDYTKVEGWMNPEILEVVAKIEKAIETRNIPVVPAVNFRIDDDHLGEGGAKTKFRANMDAINLLKELEFDGDRNATPEEQKILSQYVGWGGLADAFDESKANWANEFVELHTALSPEEYEAARASTLNAHYTSPVVIRSMYDAVGQMGFDSGNILEPSMGIGNFFGVMPDTMRNSRLYGVELDPISGKIAQKLYPNADIKIAGFETTDRKDFYDLAVGNVPFGNYKVSDKPYDKLGFSIHNYFFAKALDQVRPGGIVAFVTSRFTMDSKNSDARRYMAQKAELLGAIRLPNNAFKANAGTDVVSDIIFLQKRDHPLDIVPEWVNLTTTKDGMTMNSYFAEHPEMVMGDLAMESTPYGKDNLTVHPRDGVELSDLLKEAVTHIRGEYHAVELTDTNEKDQPDTIPATPDVKNFSYGVVDGEVYFRENSVMRHVETNEKAKERIIGMVELRRIVNELMDYQLEDFPDEKIKEKQAELSLAYDDFSKQNGLINSRANALAFADDSSYYLLCSLENVDENGELESKADIFTKRTIKPERKVTSVDTPSEALAISIGERGKVDLPFMAQLLGTPDEYETIISELQGVIFKDPLTGKDDSYEGWQTADEYLSGDVRNKLQVAQIAAKNDPSFAINVQALEKAQPKDLDASEIDVRLGATWIDPDYIQQFMQETFDTPYYLRRSIEVKFSELTAEWRISGKSSPSYNDVAAYTTYGTERANAYRILEETLNLKDIRIYDTVEDPDGKQKRVLNKKETTLAQQKQQAIKDAFRDWIWRDPKRREVLVQKYNVLFNSTRPREYDGSHITFGGMNPEITLREHQRNAIAHVLYGGNTLLAHEVGAGKSFEMAASAMESKRLGLCQKSLFVVPNHLTLQWANEFLRLYPNAKLLVATKKDFETANRKKFCARISTGDYDAIIIGHSQFEKIPLSAERQERQLREQIDEIENALAELKYSRGENFSIKQMEKTRKSLQLRLDKLTAADRKDDVVTFEQLGVDRLFVDESQAFKNLFLYTKMRNVAGLSTSEAQRSSDMFMKCRYLDELTGGRGVIFASGTPVSNSMTELYTVMRYLQYSTLQKKNLTHFDSWASTFGETTTAIELAPEGTGYRARTRFAKFFNLPELMNIFKETADIKTADQLHLPVPEAKFETVVVQPSEHQKQMVTELSERAAAVHSGVVDPTVDNMLKITSDGRKLGLDQRLMNPLLPDDPSSKLNACVQNVIRIWEEGKQEKLTQLLFCDMSTPKNDGTFNVYDDIKTKLLAHGIPESEVAFIHDADSEAKKKELFAKVRTGQVRVLLGSTQKMGAGTNVQDKLVAVHHLDVGWRPSDMTQRNGRIIRQGNQNKEVQVYQYVTEGTFDAYLYQTLENKQKFISQIMTSKSPVRSCDDVDEQALSYAEIKALCAGNPLIKEKMDLDIDVARLKVLKADHLSQRYRMEDKLLKYFPAEIEKETGFIKGFEEDIKTVAAHPQVTDGFCGMEIQGKQYAEKADAGELILAACSELKGTEPVILGSYRGFQMELSFDSFSHDFDIVLKGSMSHRVPLGTDARGNITRLDNALGAVPERLHMAKEHLEDLYNQQEATKMEIDKPFPQEAELAEKSSRLAELDAELNMENTADHSAEKTDEERPSVLADLKSRAENIPPYRHSDYREEVL